MSERKSLLDVAERVSNPPAYRSRASLSSVHERIELALAVIKGDISQAQASLALNKAGYKTSAGSAATVLAQAIWTGVRCGELKLTRVKP